jgi:hypothetical protein
MGSGLTSQSCKGFLTDPSSFRTGCRFGGSGDHRFFDVLDVATQTERSARSSILRMAFEKSGPPETDQLEAARASSSMLTISGRTSDDGSE